MRSVVTIEKCQEQTRAPCGGGSGTDGLAIPRAYGPFSSARCSPPPRKGVGLKSLRECRWPWRSRRRRRLPKGSGNHWDHTSTRRRTRMTDPQMSRFHVATSKATNTRSNMGCGRGERREVPQRRC